MSATAPHRYTVLISPRGDIAGAQYGETTGGPGSVLTRVVTVPLRDYEQVCADRDEARTVLANARDPRLAEFDAWLSMRPEFGEVLTAFRQAFGTDTSAVGAQR